MSWSVKIWVSPDAFNEAALDLLKSQIAVFPYVRSPPARSSSESDKITSTYLGGWFLDTSTLSFEMSKRALFPFAGLVTQTLYLGLYFDHRSQELGAESLAESFLMPSAWPAR
ncbi:hypothetical protein R1flu_002334 [Riccia fluitans]|uniref:Uncharacterized protein n=1 Tax=Riccia fluitans TaxID=41844 RepID=A0ABD1Y9N3_9MARC